ncbi:hypothetical protein [Hyphomicrobium sp.]|uniref:hypothetical protein n=1 Tax=Hyphomicrobium sp. TaxID=82 RepID=UPI0025BEF681|nr:hypothetical protein [Hyphomicrobium sp.]MCC7251974.1 hypothetical protein [Hyphomicrobium sp.]
MVRLIAASLFAPLAAAAFAPAVAQEDGAPSMPATLVIGYELEGHIDASESSCRAFVTEVVEWDQEATDQAVRDVCAARQKHLDAYRALQGAYGKFRAALQKQIRFDGGAAAKALASLVKSCIDMKWALSTGGHNVRIDIVPNEIAVACLETGREVVAKETARLNIDAPQPRSGH